MSYEITRDYIDIKRSRSGEKLDGVKFIVSHDTGNPGSTAYNNRNYFQNANPAASAHTFIDDKFILEIIPLDEKAFHVRYNVDTDNRLFGANANDASIGVELAYGGKIDFWEAYRRYVWYHAYLADKFGLDPQKHIVAHSTLDPSRRTDPQNALNRHGISWSQFIADVTEVYNRDFKNQEVPQKEVKGVSLPLRVGDEGEFVKEIQKDLIRAGFGLPIYGADGVYGGETQRAVMKFQKQYNLLVDGMVGPQTLTKLKEVVNSAKPINEFPLPNGILRRGDQGNNVKQIQRALLRLKLYRGSIDGIYGPLTEEAVRKFQSKYKVLLNDGIYGPNTRKYLDMELDDLS